LRSIFDVDAKLIEISNEEEKTFAPDFWIMQKKQN
jgi:peptide chain release factor 2